MDNTAGDTKKVAAATAPVRLAAAPVAAATPAPAPVAEKVDPAKTKDVVKSEDDEETIKTGNKVEPVILLPGEGKGPKAGEGSFGVFGEIAGAIGRFVTGTGNAPAKTPATETGTRDQRQRGRHRRLAGTATNNTSAPSIKEGADAFRSGLRRRQPGGLRFLRLMPTLPHSEKPRMVMCGAPGDPRSARWSNAPITPTPWTSTFTSGGSRIV